MEYKKVNHREQVRDVVIDLLGLRIDLVKVVKENLANAAITASYERAPKKLTSSAPNHKRVNPRHVRSGK